MHEIECTITIVEETWFKDGPRLEEDKPELALGEGYRLLTVPQSSSPNEKVVFYDGLALFLDGGNSQF